MSTRRMFSIRLINSARFLRMPISSQALYFHLGMHADDDGIVEAYPVIKTIGCTEDDLRVLVAKGFVQVLNDDLVSYITDWSEHNTIRPDRKIDSIYKDLLLQMNPEVKLVEKRPRADVGRTMDGQWTVNGPSMDGISKDKLSKDKLSQDRLKIDAPKRFKPPTVEEVEAYCVERNNRVDPERFVDYYTANGWVQGKGKPIKDWKAAVRNWERNEKTSQVNAAQQAAQERQRVLDQIIRGEL